MTGGHNHNPNLKQAAILVKDIYLLEFFEADLFEWTGK